MTPSQKFDQAIEQLNTFLQSWARQTRQELGLPEAGHTIGISFEPGVQLQAMPGESVITKGLYKLRGYETLRDNLTERVEVVQDSKQGIVIFRTFYGADQELATMSVAHFDRLYTPVQAHDFPGRPRAPAAGL